jgi:transposase-like protein
MAWVVWYMYMQGVNTRCMQSIWQKEADNRYLPSHVHRLHDYIECLLLQLCIASSIIFSMGYQDSCHV